MKAQTPSLPFSQSLGTLPQLRTGQMLGSVRRLYQHLSQKAFRTGGLRFQTRTRRLKLQETLQLGDKRFVAILRVDSDEFLLGGSATGISILGQLHPEPAATSFAAVLHRTHPLEEEA